MISTLTVTERQIALVISGLLSLVGLVLSAAGRHDPLGAQGFIILAFGLSGVFLVISGFHNPEPTENRFSHYYDEPIKAGIIIAMLWAIVAMFVGDWVAWLLAYPEMTFDAAWASFGRLRPIHTTGIIFGFGGNALIATSFHVMQRTSRTRLADQLSPWFVLGGYNLFCILAVTGYLMGVTQSKEYAEPEWYADIWLTIVWIAYFALYLRTLARRKEPHIYVSNWYYLAFVLVVAMLHIVNNLTMPVSLGSSKSYTVFAGVQDAMVQWWYGHNAVAFFLTSGFLGMLYYYLPKRAGRPIFSYRMSIIGFWGITFFYVWVGSHHLHYTALPQWVQTLGMTFSVMLLVPSWIAAANALLTLNGAWHKVRDDATLRFMMVAALFYGLATFEGSFLAIRPVNSLSHYTDWTVAHVHAGTLGWNSMIIFGAFYYLVPQLWKRERIYSPALVEVHFWLSIAGIFIYVFAMWNSGIIQGLMWRTYNNSGTLAYSFVDSLNAMHPYYIARATGGLLFLIGAVIGFYNICMTIRSSPAAAKTRNEQPATIGQSRLRPGEQADMFQAHYKLERYSVGLVIAIIIAASIGGIVEIAPLFTIDQTVEEAPGMRVYTPLELAGRNIYVREGCYACHSQMIRTLRDEVERYGPYSLAVESQYDHPMLWGSKRTGPDLARIGGKYSDQWHVAHLENPRDVVPASIMPAYSFLARTQLRTDDLSMHLTALKKVGVPYTDSMIEKAVEDAYGQAAPFSALADGVVTRYGDATQVRAFDGDPGSVSEMDALVAYLQIIGRLTDAAHEQKSSGDAE